MDAVSKSCEIMAMAKVASRLRSEREATLWRLVVRANLVHGTDVIRRVHAAGFPELQAGWPRLLAHLDSEGTRLKAIAEKAGMSAQATGQMIDDLEAAKIVARTRDPSDRRGVIVQFTTRGLRMLETAVQKMAEVEDEYAAALGRKRYASLKALFGELLERIDEQGGLNP